MRVLLISVLALATLCARAQTDFVPYFDINLLENGIAVKDFPWAGGLNGVQYGKIDLDGDGIKDLAGYDRSSGRVLCFLRNGDQYDYAPQYEKFFPADIQYVFILKDFDGDGRIDLFTVGNLGIKAYKNIASGSLIQWEQVSPFISFEGFSGNEVNLQVNPNDYPYIGDLDGDGDIDILNFSFSGVQSTILFYENRSVQNTNLPGLGPFQLVDDFWGKVEDCDCGTFALNGQNCEEITAREAQRGLHAGGKSVLVNDFDGDGMLELVTSHEECSELYLFEQDLPTSDDPAFERFTTNFPNSENPAQFNFYPNTMLLDLSGNEEEDLIVSPNVEPFFGVPINFSSSNWLYEKVGSSYELVTKSFLQEDMIDLGVQSSPSFYDYDQDGDLDLFIAYTDLDADNNLFSSVVQYENIGDEQNPVFEVVTYDFCDLSGLGLANMQIQWVDINSDGNQDLAIQATNNNQNQLQLLLNKGAGVTTENTLFIENIFIGFGYSTHFADVVGDPLLDLLVGKSSGGLILYENVGTAESPQFRLETNSFLGIGDDFFRSSLKVHLADITNDDQLDLLTTDLSGTIRLFSNVKENPSTFDTLRMYNALDQNFGDHFFGKRNSITFANLFDGQYPSMILGGVSGGIRVFRNQEEFPVQSGEELVFELFPNPTSSGEIFIKTTQDLSLSIHSLEGKQILSKLSYSAFSNQAIDVSVLKPGVYLVIARFPNGETKSKKLVLY